jgi:hypothetical protein
MAVISINMQRNRCYHRCESASAIVILTVGKKLNGTH